MAERKGPRAKRPEAAAAPLTPPEPTEQVQPPPGRVPVHTSPARPVEDTDPLVGPPTPVTETDYGRVTEVPGVGTYAHHTPPSAPEQLVQLQRDLEAATTERDALRVENAELRGLLAGLNAQQADLAPHPDEPRMVTPTNPNVTESAVPDSPAQVQIRPPGVPAPDTGSPHTGW